MRLDPSKFTCPEHGDDLTRQVSDLLEDEGPVAYDLPLLGRAARPRPFEVEVTCPGAEGGSSHTLMCAGTYSS